MLMGRFVAFTAAFGFRVAWFFSRCWALWLCLFEFACVLVVDFGLLLLFSFAIVFMCYFEC